MFFLLQLNYETGVLKKNGGIDAYKNHSSLGGRGGGSKREKPNGFLREKKKIFESFVSRNLLNSIF